MSLAAMQRDFAGWLTDRPGSMAAWVDGAAQAGLDVYHNAYHMRLADCLHEMFEKTALWLGDEAFMTAARAHIDGRPPHGWTLGVYGDGFDRTLARLYPDDREVESWSKSWMTAPTGRIAGGADEMLLNTIAERILGLPQDHRPDKGVAFNDIPR
ncbi:DNA-binding domain-containing protein [Sphingobium cupriresistens]|uniref:DUF2063 domain-containing protein n=1 Tax=Sphingobium cupriresistens TaxID=1132417 RepID=A0A8G2DXZ5_9SPHN|nr:DNA-binding domain-containing protein [Sphingobium cupriresistens]RYM07527.1 DUF2063 domain-containing protein [Sphingobium cupriresistens]